MVNIVQKTNGGSSLASSFSLAYTSNVTANSILVASVTFGAAPDNTTQPAISVSDTQGNAWSQAVRSNATQGGTITAIFAAVYYATAGSSAADTFQISESNGVTGYFQVNIYEVSGITTTGINTGTGSQVNGSYSSFSTGNTTINKSTYFAITALYLNNLTPIWSAGANFTSDASVASARNNAEYSTTGLGSPTTFPSSTTGTASDWTEAGAVFDISAVSAVFFESGPKRQYRRGERNR